MDTMFYVFFEGHAVNLQFYKDFRIAGNASLGNFYIEFRHEDGSALKASMESSARAEMMMKAIFKTMKAGERQVFISSADTRNRQPTSPAPEELESQD